ncbi:hypothetical protein Pan189_25380 [Stratiformator vulcanicus]|uniref:Uncharacterized protein n=2 Tax=Stratiformator vulcanicus TaxID=2527980 RepID=A0A517R2Q4_9PLAN|nr:hypothetical protein Pan189_25380 [Stratiformator vulcanicus]
MRYLDTIRFTLCGAAILLAVTIVAAIVWAILSRVGDPAGTGGALAVTATAGVLLGIDLLVLLAATALAVLQMLSGPDTVRVAKRPEDSAADSDPRK